MDESAILAIEGLRTALSATRWCALTTTLRAGEIVRLAGPSGSGKTSMLRTITRLQPAASGTMRLRGVSVQSVPPPAWRRAIAFLPQRAAMVPGSVEANVRAGFTLAVANSAPYDAACTERFLAAVGLSADVLPQDARSLSGGEASRVAFVRAALVQPRVLLLDETTAALDPDAAVALVTAVARYVAEGERAALVVAHNPEPWESVLTGRTALEVGS